MRDGHPPAAAEEEPIVRPSASLARPAVLVHARHVLPYELSMAIVIDEQVHVTMWLCSVRQAATGCRI